MEGAPNISTPEEELAYLRVQVAEKERQLSGEPQAHVISETIIEHKKVPVETVLAPAYRMEEQALASQSEEIIKALGVHGTEEGLASLSKIVEEKGIKNALAMAEKIGNPALEDDFHRFLVRYIASGLPTKELDEKAPAFKALRMTLYEVALPRGKGAAGKEKPLKELISAMEQFYAGLLSIGAANLGEPTSFTLELAVPSDRSELAFYVAVPNSKAALFEKQLLAIFPDAHLSVQKNDYNIFVEGGASFVSSAKLAAHPALPIKEYSEFDYDPLNAILNAFAKIEHTGEGAALQIVVEPRGDRHLSHYRKILSALRKGEPRSQAFSTPETLVGEFGREISGLFFGGKKSKDPAVEREASARRAEENKAAIAEVEKKLAAPIVGVTVRILASSTDAVRAGSVISELESAFNQFANTSGNRLEFAPAEDRRAFSLYRDFSFRLPGKDALPLSLRELTTLYHFPPSGIDSSPNLKQARFTHAAAPLSLPNEGVLLGTNSFRGTETSVRLVPEDRLRHLYVIGQTGTGKTVLMKNMIIQDIKNGDGCCFIDPHGSDIHDILAAIPPERYQDVIYFDPADVSRPFGLNFLEYDPARPEQKTFIVNELLAIFRRLYGDVPESMGPMFEQYFRNATLLVMEDPSSGSTMLDIARVLSNAEFRNAKLAKCMNPVVSQFWNEIATKAEGEASLASIVPYITNKFDDFTANDFVRPIVGQQESSFKFREVIDRKKILLVNLSKGRLGERNSNLLGLIVVGKLFMAALSRADNPRGAHPPFYLYIDEFQNVTTDSIPGILSEARKYKLALTVAHQFLNQIEEKTRAAVFGNVGSMAIFRVGEEDAEFFEKQFAPVFKALDFVNIENYNAYARLLVAGVPQQPFDFRTSAPPPGNAAQVEDLMHLSAQTYGRDRATVETMIRERYLSH